MSAAQPPTLYEWAGGSEAFERLTAAFYEKVKRDELLEPVFRGMDPKHPHHVAVWLAEVFGGPPLYTDQHGGYPHMLENHRGVAIDEARRRRWVSLICAAADDAGLPTDPEFRSAFVAYVEWGTRLALANTQPGANPPPQAPVPRWGWGEAPPYTG
jgi:hemoglobin